MLAMRVARSIDADHTTRVLDQIVRERGAGPELVRMDSGPDMTANALRDWCRFRGAESSFIEPGFPVAEPVRGVVRLPRPRRGAVGRGESQVVINDWKDIYNHQRPHSRHGWRTTAALAATVTEGGQHNRPQLS